MSDINQKLLLEIINKLEDNKSNETKNKADKKEELKRLFKSKNKPNLSSTENSKKKNKTFLRDVYLLPSHMTVIPIDKTTLFEEERVAVAVEFKESDDWYEIIEKLKNTFRIIEITDVDLMKAERRNLYKINRSKSSIDACFLKHISGQGNIYFKEVDTKTDDVDIVIKDKLDKDDDVIVVNNINESISIDPFFFNIANNSFNCGNEVVIEKEFNQTSCLNNDINETQGLINHCIQNCSMELPSFHAFEQPGLERLNWDELNECEVVEEFKRYCCDQIGGEKSIILNVTRSNVLNEFIELISKSEFDCRKKLNIKFIRDDGSYEEAVDATGVTREALRLAVNELINKSGIFTTGKCMLINKETCKTNGFYYAAGVIMSLAIVYGACTMNIFSEIMVDVLVNDVLDKLEPSVSDVYEVSIKDKLQQLLACKSFHEFNFVYEDSDLQSIIKIMNLNLPLTLTNKERLVKAICRFLVIDSIYKSIIDFKKGLNIHGVLSLANKFPKQMKALFEFKSIKLSAIKLRELFFLDLKRNNDSIYQKKVLAMRWFFDYLDEIENGSALSTFDEILKFTTATESIPFILYSPRPSICFGEAKYPTANTCSNILNLPINCPSYPIFKQNLDCAFTMVTDFGLF